MRRRQIRVIRRPQPEELSEESNAKYFTGVLIGFGLGITVSAIVRSVRRNRYVYSQQPYKF